MNLRVAVVVCAVLGASPQAFADGLSATQIMEKNFAVSRVLGSTQDASFELINKEGQKRLRNTLSATKLQSNGVDVTRVVKFLSPSDVRGTATLLVEHSSKDDDIWIYLPGLKKVRRLVSSNKKDSFVGTDFSYGDIIGHKVSDWQHQLLKEEAVDGAACYVVESVPIREDVKSSSGYSKRQSWVRKDNFVVVKSEIWDASGRPLKTLHFGDVQQIDPAHQKWQPMLLEANNTQTGHKTILRLANFKLEPGIADDLFTTRNLEQER